MRPAVHAEWGGTSTADGERLRLVLQRISRRFRTRVSRQPDGTLILQPSAGGDLYPVS